MGITLITLRTNGKIASVPAPVAQRIERRPPEPKATVRVRPGVLFINLIFLNPNLRHHNNGCRGDLFGDTAFGAFPQEYLQRLSYAVSQTWG